MNYSLFTFDNNLGRRRSILQNLGQINNRFDFVINTNQKSFYVTENDTILLHNQY